MKIGRFLALGTLAYGAYYAYKRREDIKEEILDLKQDLNYKKRVFKKDLEPRLNIIQERLQKYQGDDKE